MTRFNATPDPFTLDAKADACRRKARAHKLQAATARASGNVHDAARHEQRAKKYAHQAAVFERAARNAAGAEYDASAGFDDADLASVTTCTVGGAW
jgi:hypothetical protein